MGNAIGGIYGLAIGDDLFGAGMVGIAYWAINRSRPPQATAVIP